MARGKKPKKKDLTKQKEMLDIEIQEGIFEYQKAAAFSLYQLALTFALSIFLGSTYLFVGSEDTKWLLSILMVSVIICCIVVVCLYCYNEKEYDSIKQKMEERRNL
ncbi:hypothetical protein KAW38_00385 [Candidatus Micrarchaeota archaeon]|nr:hypothetical protein [Candidatus Micrarchaeota archaeon]